MVLIAHNHLAIYLYFYWLNLNPGVEDGIEFVKYSSVKTNVYSIVVNFPVGEKNYTALSFSLCFTVLWHTACGCMCTKSKVFNLHSTFKSERVHFNPLGLFSGPCWASLCSSAVYAGLLCMYNMFYLTQKVY